MYRILIADDEGIMLEAFKNVISGAFGANCAIETAKTGRAVTEIAETFHPDIVFMDIHMPGINGIQAMREIRKFNTSALFYVVSAYNKFDYAKEAIDLGVERYLTKPISKATIISTVQDAIEKVDSKRNQRSNMLKIQEKLETVIPVVETGFVSSLLFQQEMQTAEYYQQLAVDLHMGKEEYFAQRDEIIKTYKASGRRKQEALKELKKSYKTKVLSIPEDLCWLYGEFLEDYLHDVEICQSFAKRNREKMAEIILEEVGDTQHRTLMITHCNAPDRAETIKKLLTDKVQFRDCLIMDTRGVSSMYANDGGIIVVL